MHSPAQPETEVARLTRELGEARAQIRRLRLRQLEEACAGMYGLIKDQLDHAQRYVQAVEVCFASKLVT